MTDPASLASRIFLSISLALAASAAACANVIVDGVGSSDGGGGSTSGTPTPSTSGSGTTTSPQAIAVPASREFGNDGTGGSGSTGTNTTVGGGIDERLFLEIGNEARSCTSPEGSFKCGTWSLSIGLSPAFQRPGTFTIQYDEDTVRGVIFENDASADGSDQNCSGGGGPLVHGTLTIMEIDETHVLFTVQGVDGFTEYYAMDGTYDAPRCGP